MDGMMAYIRTSNFVLAHFVAFPIFFYHLNMLNDVFVENIPFFYENPSHSPHFIIVIELIQLLYCCRFPSHICN